MSYGLIFLQRLPGESWEEALDRFEDDGSDPVDADAGVWRQIVEGIQHLRPGVAEQGRELFDEEASIQISCWSDEASIFTPYWYTGERAREVVRRMYAYSAVVERVTGFEGYDSQLGLSIVDAAARIDVAVTVFDNGGRYEASQGVTGRSGVAVEVAGPLPVAVALPAPLPGWAGRTAPGSG